MTETGVIMALSSQLRFMGCSMYSSKTLDWMRFAVAWVCFRFLKTSFWEDLSNSRCQCALKSFCFRISLTLLLTASLDSSVGLSLRSWMSLMASVRVEFVVRMSPFWA